MVDCSFISFSVGMLHSSTAPPVREVTLSRINLGSSWVQSRIAEVKMGSVTVYTVRDVSLIAPS